jgi:hypothetical protein
MRAVPEQPDGPRVFEFRTTNTRGSSTTEWNRRTSRQAPSREGIHGLKAKWMLACAVCHECVFADTRSTSLQELHELAD